MNRLQVVVKRRARSGARRVKAVDAGVVFIGIDQTGGQIPVPGGDHARRAQGHGQTLLAERQQLIGAVGLADVARHTQQLVRLAVGPQDGRDLHIPPFGCAHHRGGLADKVAEAAGQRCRHRRPGLGMELVKPEIGPGTAANGIEITHLQQAHATLGHESQVGVQIEHLDAVAGRGQHAAQERHIGALRLGGLPLSGDVTQNLEESDVRAVAAAQRHHIAAAPKQRAILSQVLAFAVSPARGQGLLHLSRKAMVGLVLQG